MFTLPHDGEKQENIGFCKSWFLGPLSQGGVEDFERSMVKWTDAQ